MTTGHGERLRVLWVAKGLGPGGMERLLVHQARTGDHDRFDYHAAYLVPRPDSVVPELEELGVECVRLTTGSASDPRWTRRLAELVGDRRIDVVHAHSPQPAAMSRAVLRAHRNGPRLVYTEHNTWDCYGRSTRLANALTYPLDHAQFAVSSDARASVPRVLRNRVEVLTHGIDVDAVRSVADRRLVARRALGVRDDQVVITNVARLRTEKAQDVLLEATAQLVADRDDIVVLSVGHGPLEAELKAQHGRLGLGDRFRFLGFRHDALELLGASDVFCLSSKQEGLPVAFMEACALGLPTVSTRVGGLPEHIDDGVSGLLVPPGDPQALSGALRRVSENAAFRRQLAEGAAGHATEFDARRAVQRQEAVYDRLCGRSAASSGSGVR